MNHVPPRALGDNVDMQFRKYGFDGATRARCPSSGRLIGSPNCVMQPPP